MRLVFYNDEDGNTIYGNFKTRKIKNLGSPVYFNPEAVVIDGNTFYVANQYLFNPLFEQGQPDMAIVSTYQLVNQDLYGGGGKLKFHISSERNAGIGGQNRVSCGNFQYEDSRLLWITVTQQTNDPSEDLEVFLADYTTLTGIQYVFFIVKISDGFYRYAAISKNAFEGSFPERFAPPTIPDEDGGYGTGSTPSGNQDGTVVNVDVGGDTVNVLPPSVTVGVEVNMPQTLEPQINHPAGINLALVSNSALSALNDALWGRNKNGFDDLWLQFKNYNYNPIQAIISCFKLPLWVTRKISASASSDAAIGIGGTTIDGFTGKAIARGATVRETFETKPLTQFNTFQDFVGVNIRAFAPFVGWFDLDPSLCLGVSDKENKCKIKFEYTVDVTNGNVGVVIWATTAGKSDTQAHETPIAMGSGNCAYPVLLAANDRGISDVVGGFTQMFGGVISAAAGFTTENPLMAISGAANAIAGTASAMFPQQHTTTVGGVSGSVGYLGYLTPFVQVIKPRYAEPSQYSPIYGRPSYAGDKVSDFKGHWAQLEVHSNDIDFASKEDREMIIDALANGVYV